ncbi:hypothetical protein GGR53DRAFT_464374 [Hypoxylon sp. FL1150]|nr:hypothetical protein GGR53DRAFT_464374 [Hypoxylon sp. FL1150]
MSTPTINMASSEVQQTLERLQHAMCVCRLTSLAEALCRPGATPVPDTNELLCHFAVTAVRTAADLRRVVLGASAVREAFAEWSNAYRSGDRPPLPSPQAALFIASLGENLVSEMRAAHEDAVNWDAALCVGRIVRYLETEGPWTLAASDRGEESEKTPEDYARERFAIGIRVFLYLHHQAVQEEKEIREAKQSAIEAWLEEIPKRGFVDPQAWVAEETEETTTPDDRRDAIDLPRPERQHILLEALSHWDEIDDSQKEGTKKDFLQKLREMFSRQG